jgi:nitric oxide reductase activation protein
MEETVGLWWHQALSRMARSTHAHAAVQLKDVEKSIGIVFRSAGGAAALRLATASATARGQQWPLVTQTGRFAHPCRHCATGARCACATGHAGRV